MHTTTIAYISGFTVLMTILLLSLYMSSTWFLKMLVNQWNQLWADRINLEALSRSGQKNLVLIFALAKPQIRKLKKPKEEVSVEPGL